MKNRPFAKKIAACSESDHRNPVVAVNKAEFLKFYPVRNFLEEGGQGIICHEPKGVAPEKVFVVGRVRILISV